MGNKNLTDSSGFYEEDMQWDQIPDLLKIFCSAMVETYGSFICPITRLEHLH